MTKPQSGEQHPYTPHSSSARKSAYLGILCLLSVAVLSGCVSSGKYEAEKARALNFQRLLAQEERRAGELNTQLQETKRQVAALESQNRDATVELDALREQIRREEERAAARDFPAPSSDFGTAQEDAPLPEDSLSEFGLGDLSFDESDFTDFGDAEPEPGGFGEPMYYTVVRGDTLYSISREYGVTVRQLKRWNNLADNIISIGQRLIVSQP